MNTKPVPVAGQVLNVRQALSCNASAMGSFYRLSFSSRSNWNTGIVYAGLAWKSSVTRPLRINLPNKVLL